MLFLWKNALTAAHSVGLFLVVVLVTSPNVSAQVPDHHTSTGTGPFDYTNPADVQKKLPIVEQFHFTADVEHLRRGRTSTIMNDLMYTLKVFPNHHRALDAVGRLWIRYQKKGKLPPPGGNMYETPDFWFKRAMEFAPHDGTVHIVYGVYLHRQKKLDAALEQYKDAQELLPDSPELHYNLGLLYIDRENYDLAKLHAEKAYRQGFPLPALRNKLIRAGAWSSRDGQ